MLLVILVAALALRIVGINWDDYTHIHPDERFLTTMVSRIGHTEFLTQRARERCPEEKLAYYYFNTDCSYLNPNNVDDGSFAYGTLPLFMVYNAARLAEQLQLSGPVNPADWTTYDYVQLVGRAVSALVDLLTVVFVFLIGRRLFTARHGLLAAALYAFAVLPIQLAHFWAVDSFTNLFFVIGLYAVVELSLRDRAWPYVVFGLALGAALASRINMLPMAGLLPLALLIQWQQQVRRNDLPTQRRWLMRVVLLTLSAAAISLIAFRVFQPYAFVGPTFVSWNLNPKWLEDVRYVSELSSTASDGWPPAVQWFSRIRYVYPWFNLSVWGLGPALGLVATLALCAAILRQVFKRRLSPAVGLLSVWVVGYFVFMGNLHQMTMRYYLPIYAALVLLVAWGVLALPRRWMNWIGGIVLVATGVWAIAFTHIYRQPLTRVEASRWIAANIPGTITLQDSNGRILPADVPLEVFQHSLQTAYRDESYLGEPFEVPLNRNLTAFTITFTDAVSTRVSVQLLQELGNGQQSTVFQFSLDSDEQGVIHFDVKDFPDFPGVASGSYRWHILNDWDGGPALRYFMFSSTWDDNGTSVHTTAEFLSPFEPVRYALLGPQSPLRLRSSAAFTTTRLQIPHMIGLTDEVILQRDDGSQIRARVVNTQDDEPALGAQRLFDLEEPLQVERGQFIHLTTTEPVYITGTALATEGGWDDSLPLAFCPTSDTETLWQRWTNLYPHCDTINSYARGYYVELPLHMAETDSDAKYRRMGDILAKADYLVMSSNRFYDALPRVQRRFAMSTNYYTQLFGGKLDYRLLREFASFPTFLGIPLRDQVLPSTQSPAWLNEWEAEEAFTVYDHPTAFVFKNEGFSADKLPVFIPFVEYDSRSRVLLRQMPEATFTIPPELSQRLGVRATLALWTLGFVLLGWLSLPLMYVLFPNLPLRGFSIGRGFSWLLLALAAWWLQAGPKIPTWTQGGLWLLVLLLAALNALIAYRKRRELRAYIRQHWRALLLAELLFLAALGIGVLLRAVDPDLWHVIRGGEKPMDFAYLNAVLRTPSFPPPNPWLAGFEINYYYFGFVVAAVPIKLGNFAPAVGTNLVLATVYAVVFVNVFVLAYTLLTPAGRKLRGLLAAISAALVMLAGNLGTLNLLAERNLNIDPNRWYWYPTRILGESANGAGGAFNEFPAFSFLYGDLHAHILTLLAVTLFMIVLLSLVQRRRMWLGLLIGSLAGIIYMSNTWDVLLYVPLGALAMWLATRSIERFIRLSILVGIGGVVTILPFYLKFSMGEASGVELWQGERSLLEPFLLVWGIQIGIALLWLAHRLKATFLRWTNAPLHYGVIALVLIAILFLPPEVGTSALCLVVVAAGLVLAARDEAAYRPVHVALSLIFLILLLIEYVVVKGDVGRMNTVFKISFQLWLWLGLLIPMILLHLLRNRRYLQVTLSLILIAFGLLFPVMAIPARYYDNETGKLTLNGNEFMSTLVLDQYGTPIVTIDDWRLVEFMRATIRGFPVIAEWYETEYAWNSRVSVQTGLPSVIGWRNHMRQQYAFQHEEIDKRIQDIQTLYTTSDLSQMRRVIAQYDIQYIVVGQLEKNRMSFDAINNFDALVQRDELNLVYENGSSKLYQVAQTAQSGWFAP